MKVQTAKQMLMIQGWAAQINACNQSGQTVKQWCKENGIAIKTYYYHLKRVREEMLEAIESCNDVQTAGAAHSYLPMEHKEPDYSGDNPSLHKRQAAFVALPMPQVKGAVITVRMGGCTVEISNGTDDATMEQVLRVVARL